MNLQIAIIAFMSVCTPCKPTQLLPDCFDNLIIGTVGAANTAYFVYIKNISTGRVKRYDAMSDGAKLLTVALDDSFSQNQSYELWVTLAIAPSQESREDVLIANTTDTCTCFALRFEITYDGNGDENSFTNITLTAA